MTKSGGKDNLFSGNIYLFRQNQGHLYAEIAAILF